MVKLKHFTFRRILNIVKVKASLKLKRTKVFGKPYILMIEPTNYCNLNCPLCPTGNGTLKRKKGFLLFENYKKIIDKLGKYLIEVILWNYGEPFLNKDIYKMIGYTTSKNINVVVSTNGHFFKTKESIEKLLDSKLDNLIIALDGASQKTLSKYRKNANFEEIVQGIKNIVLEKQKRRVNYPLIELQFITMKHNEHELPIIKKLAKELKVDKISIKLVSDFQNPKKVRKYLPKDTQFIRKKVNTSSCPYLWKSITINWNGEVVPCCVDANSDYLMGNFFKSNILKIWNSQKYILFRKKNLQRKILLCRACNSVNQILTKSYK